MTHMEGVFNGTTTVTNPPHSSLAVGQNVDFWTRFGSNASDTNMTSRISQNEVVETSTNSNSQGMRYFAMTAITAMTFLKDNVSSTVREAVATQSVTTIGKAISGLNQQASSLGLSQERVKSRMTFWLPRRRSSKHICWISRGSIPTRRRPVSICCSSRLRSHTTSRRVCKMVW